MASAPYVSAKFKLTAKFEKSGVEFKDVIAMSASFALNTIPTATLTVATGTLVNDSGTFEPATIHDAKKQLKPREPVKVTLEIIPGDGATDKLRAGKYVIFDGFFVGIGYQRSSNAANYVLHLTHWLDDLNNSSAINGNWFPGVPGDYAQTALNDAIAAGDGAGAAAPSITAGLTTLDKVQNDIWEDVIKKIFERVAGWAGGSFPGKIEPEGNDPQSKNDAAKAALARIPGEGKPYAPLGLKIEATAGENIAGSIAGYFTKTINESFAHNSFWDKLVGEYAAQFLFAISPAVSWATPIPFCGGLQWQDGGLVIAADEYNYANFNANMSRVIESVNVYHPAKSATAAPIGPDIRTPVSYYKLCATFPQSGTDITGLKLFKTTPGWLQNTELWNLSGTTAARAGRLAAGAAGHAAEDAKPPGTVASGTAAEATRKILDLFAQQWYITEFLQQRYGELSGPLRFDIAPGSTVKIETPIRDRQKETNPTEFVVATVMSVSYVINAERATAGTSFAIAHTRTDGEIANAAPYLAADPPLYKTRWSGGPLAIKEGA